MKTFKVIQKTKFKKNPSFQKASFSNLQSSIVKRNGLNSFNSLFAIKRTNSFFAFTKLNSQFSQQFKFFSTETNLPTYQHKEEENNHHHHNNKQNEEFEGHYALVANCNVCKHKIAKQFSKLSYHKGVVIIRCEGCKSLHLVSDNLGLLF